MVEDHPYKPCHYDTPARRPAAEAIGLCLCPYGMHRCHVRGCGRREDEHALGRENVSESASENRGLPGAS
jgi:hypothetical protein